MLSTSDYNEDNAENVAYFAKISKFIIGEEYRWSAIINSRHFDYHPNYLQS